MPEKTHKTISVKLVRNCGLGNIIADIESVSGGFLHRMYRVTTDHGVYAVKHLNPQIMKRPDAQDNYAAAEKSEAIPESRGIPIVPALVIAGSRMQRADDQFFYVFRWQEGNVTDWNHISGEMCRKAGAILGKIHAISPENVEARLLEAVHTDWRGYAERAKEKNSVIAPLLKENEELLVFAESELNRARALLPPLQCISNEDMDPKKMMWDNGVPWTGKLRQWFSGLQRRGRCGVHMG